MTVSASADPATERDKRRQHVPYIRAATDCLADAVYRNSKFPLAVETDNFRHLTTEAIDPCTQPLLAMVRMHDAIFGGGGMEFYKGPYLLDIDRAIRSRLSARIAATRADLARQTEQRQAEAARAATERAEAETRARVAQAEKVAVAEKVRDLIRDRTMGCIGKQAVPMLITDEKAEVIAKAAMLFCEGEVNALTAATIDVLAAGGETGNEQAIRSAAKRRVEEVVTAHVVRAKAELLLGARPDSSKQPSPSASPTL